MDKLEQLKQTAVKVKLDETFQYFDSWRSKRTGIIKSQIPTINGLEIEFEKGERGIKYLTGPILSGKEAPVKYQHSGYGFLKPFEIIDGQSLYVVENGAGDLNIKIGQEFACEGTLWEIESNCKIGKGYFRAVFPIDGLVRTPVSYFLGSHFSVGTSLRIAGYVLINIDGHEIGFYDYDYKKERFLFVDCNDAIEYSLFEKYLQSLIYSYAFISGCLVRNQVDILKFSKKDFSELKGFQFRCLKDSISSDLELVNPREFKEYANRAKTEYFPIHLFSKLNELCYHKAPLLRAIRILTESRGQAVEIETASVFVALETIKQIVIDENESKVKPFRNNDFAEKLIAELKERIAAVSENEFIDRRAVLSKIENLNMVGNNNSFKLAFELVGFKLTKKDEKCIAMRNRFLHGNIPFEDEASPKKDKAIKSIYLDAHLLTSALVLKYAGYNGVIKNFLKYWDLVNGIPNEAELFREI